MRRRLVWILCKHGHWRLAYNISPSLAWWYAATGMFYSFEEDKPNE